MNRRSTSQLFRNPLPTLLGPLVVIAATFSAARPAVAIPIAVGDPQVYSIVQFYANSGPSEFITPNPVASSSALGLLEAKNANNATVGSVLTTGFGLYGATADWPGHGQHANGTDIEGTVSSLLYDQRYRGSQDFISDLHMNLFGMSLIVADLDRRFRQNFVAGFNLMVLLLPIHPPAPTFLDVVNFDFNQSVYALRMSASAGGRDGTFDYSVWCEGATGCTPQPVVQQGPLAMRVDIPDMSFDLGEVIPRDNEFTVRTYLSVYASGPPGEGFAHAQFFDPVRGFGAEIRGVEAAAPGTPVPEPVTLVQLGIGLAVIAARTRARRRVDPDQRGGLS